MCIPGFAVEVYLIPVTAFFDNLHRIAGMQYGMKKMMAMLLASVMAAGTFTTTAFAHTGDDVQKNTPVSTAAQETDAAESTNAGKTDNTDSIEIDPDMQVLPDGYEVSFRFSGLGTAACAS